MKIIKILAFNILTISFFLAINASEQALIRQKKVIVALDEDITRLEEKMIKFGLPIHFCKPTALPKKDYNFAATLMEKRYKYYAQLSKYLSLYENYYRPAIDHLTYLQSLNLWQKDYMDQNMTSLYNNRMHLITLINQLEIDAGNIHEK